MCRDLGRRALLSRRPAIAHWLVLRIFRTPRRRLSKVSTATRPGRINIDQTDNDAESDGKRLAPRQNHHGECADKLYAKIVAHHKTGAVAPHPPEYAEDNGTVFRFYEEAEETLAALPRLGVAKILRQVSDSFVTVQHTVQRMRAKLGLPAHFTLAGMACIRTGGCLTDGQGRALSTHKTQQFYEGYAKRTAKRILSATRKRFAHEAALVAAEAVQNETATSVQNETSDAVQNGKLAKARRR